MRDFDHFGYYGPGFRFGALHLIGPLLLLVILAMLVYLTIMTFRRTRGSGTSTVAGPVAPPPAGNAPTLVATETPLDVVKMRYARGEITSEEFEKLKQDLQ